MNGFLNWHCFFQILKFALNKEKTRQFYNFKKMMPMKKIEFKKTTGNTDNKSLDTYNKSTFVKFFSKNHLCALAKFAIYIKYLKITIITMRIFL